MAALLPTTDRRPIADRALRQGRAGRVLILVQNLPVPLDRRVWLEAQALVSAGFQVSVVCPRGEDDEPSYELLDGVHVHKYPPPPPAHGFVSFAWEVLYCWLCSAWLTLRVLRREGFDVIQACNPPDTFFALAAPFKLLGKRFVYDQHDLCPELFDVRFPDGPRALRRVIVFLERCTFRLADRVIATNHSFRDVAIRRGRRRRDDVTIVRSGPPREGMRPGRSHAELRNGRRHLVCYLGIMGPQDGVDLLLEAIAHLVLDRRRADCHFALLGFGDRFDALRARARELGLDDWVTFTGRADDRTIDAYLSTADLAVAPDPKNPFNDRCTMNKVVEYLAYALPVVSFDLAETRVTAGDAARYVRGGHAYDLADAIAELLDDPIARGRMGRLGRDRFETRLSWEHGAAAYVGLYDALIGRPTAGDERAADDVIVLDDDPRVIVLPDAVEGERARRVVAGAAEGGAHR